LGWKETDPGPNQQPNDKYVRGPMIFTTANTAGRPDTRLWGWNFDHYDHGNPAEGGGVEQQRGNPGSLLRHYMKIQNMKSRYPWIAWGRTDNIGIDTDNDGQVGAYRVTDDNPQSPTFGKSVVIAHNTRESPREGNYPDGYLKIPPIPGVARINCYEAVSSWQEPAAVPVSYDAGLDAYWLRPYTTAIFREY